MKHKHSSTVGFSAGDKDYAANFTISGRYSPATFHHDAEYPDVELCCIERDGWGDSGVVAEADYEALGIDATKLQADLADRALEAADDDGPDVDALIDAARDRRLEGMND